MLSFIVRIWNLKKVGEIDSNGKKMVKNWQKLVKKKKPKKGFTLTKFEFKV